MRDGSPGADPARCNGIDDRQIVERVAEVTKYRDRDTRMTRSLQDSAGSEIG
jgi:hypothetical protein